MLLREKHSAGLIDLTRIAVFGLLLAIADVACAAAEAVGEVSFAIGMTRLIDGNGRSNAAARGMPVHASDRVETEEGGHVHIRFVDGAFVSVRPDSRLFIETYRYDAARPENSAIRFRLEKGVARSISGKGTEAAREHFRLNTPIAAIGVKGTDFVVRAESERVWVTINRGAIVLSPLGEGCAADALGPCATAATRALSADMGKVMLEFRRQQSVPNIVPINGTPSLDRVSPPRPEEPSSAARGSKGTSEQNAEVLAVRAIQSRTQAISSAPAALPDPLVWGRWWMPLRPGDTLSVPFPAASDGRNATVGNDYYALFRVEPALPVLASNLGKVDFTLRDAQVHLLRGGVAELGRVDGGWLSVDFTSRQFATGVSMSHPQAGSASLNVAGHVRDDGVFAVSNTDGRVAGALTIDGKAAGYFFERPVSGGSFSGITRWAR